MKVRDVIRLLERDGWYEHSQRGSHRHFKHPRKQGKITVPGHDSDDLNPKTRDRILHQAGIK